MSLPSSTRRRFFKQASVGAGLLDLMGYKTQDNISGIGGFPYGEEANGSARREDFDEASRICEKRHPGGRWCIGETGLGLETSNEPDNDFYEEPASDYPSGGSTS